MYMRRLQTWDWFGSIATLYKTGPRTSERTCLQPLNDQGIKFRIKVTNCQLPQAYYVAHCCKVKLPGAPRPENTNFNSLKMFCLNQQSTSDCYDTICYFKLRIKGLNCIIYLLFTKDAWNMHESKFFQSSIFVQTQRLYMIHPLLVKKKGKKDGCFDTTKEQYCWCRCCPVAMTTISQLPAAVSRRSYRHVPYWLRW